MVISPNSMFMRYFAPVPLPTTGSMINITSPLTMQLRAENSVFKKHGSMTQRLSRSIVRVVPRCRTGFEGCAEMFRNGSGTRTIKRDWKDRFGGDHGPQRGTVKIAMCRM